jgi:hypothetical protein
MVVYVYVAQLAVEQTGSYGFYAAATLVLADRCLL